MAAIEGARFGHVNVTGPDWRVLAAFYGDVFGCELVGDLCPRGSRKPPVMPRGALSGVQ